MQQEFAESCPSAAVHRSSIETMPLGVGKDTSLEILLRAKGLTPANLMACGDGWNDLPMIRPWLVWASPWATPRRQSRPPPITRPPTYDHDGVGLAVEKFILERGGVSRGI